MSAAGPLLWVVGAGGLLGAEVLSAARARGLEVWSPEAIRWSDPALAEADLAREAGAFLDHAAGRPWQLAWCAGAGVTGTSSDALDAEVRVFRAALAALAQHGADARGAFFLASSAGGVYAGSASPPFDESTTPVALSSYGGSKLLLEESLRAWSEQTGVSVLVGRIANLYGPGQNLAKPQGLISHVCRAQLLRRPISIYVPLDTLRNYIYAADCAHMVIAGLSLVQERTREGDWPSVCIKVMAGPEAVSIAFILAELNRILKRRPLVVHGTSATARFQASDLRMRSVVLPELDACVRTPLVVGMSFTLERMRHSLRQGLLT